MQEDDQVFLRKVTAATIRVVLLGAWILWCLQIVLPFVVPIIWGGIIATAVLPLVHRLFPGKAKLGALSFAAISLVLIIVPSYLVLGSIAELAVSVGKQLAHGELKVPAPRADVASWPLIGPKVHQLWTDAFNTPSAVIEAHLPHLRQAGQWLLRSLGSLTFGILETLFAVAVAATFLVMAETTHGALLPVVERLAPRQGAALLKLAAATVRSVAKGVLGVAALQALLAWVGMFAAGVPVPGAWALLVLILGVAQLPSILVLGPVIAYVFMHATTGTAIAFAVWALLVGLSDNVLKPLLLGRGAGVPTLVIVVGAIGGMISSGIIGLFVGAVLLAVGYELFMAWLRGSEEPTSVL
jgi:predicted PurR-regulated permease PerM